MAAYLIANVRVTDPDKYRGYTALSPGAIAAAGGEFLVRGGRNQVLEGDFTPDRVVIVRFDSMQAAQAFYESALYQAARAQREGATAFFHMYVVDGI